MDERTRQQFLLLTGEEEENEDLWAVYVEVAANAMNSRLQHCTEEQKAAYAGEIALATAALAAMYYEQAAAVFRPEKMTAGDLRLEYGAQKAAAFFRSCMEALAPIAGGSGGFCRVEA